MLTDCDAVAIVMHKAGGLAMFDCATAAVYTKVMNRESSLHDCYPEDSVFAILSDQSLCYMCVLLD